MDQPFQPVLRNELQTLREKNQKKALAAYVEEHIAQFVCRAALDGEDRYFAALPKDEKLFKWRDILNGVRVKYPDSGVDFMEKLVLGVPTMGISIYWG